MLDQMILATDNPGKIAELQALLTPIHCIPQHQLGITSPVETGLTFVENAILKARHACQYAGKPTPALADDSGLVVPALQGQPGIYSARFAKKYGKNQTQDNITCLLEKMQDIPEEHRHAYFYCAIAVLRSESDPAPWIAIGTCHGIIQHEPSGQKGFGYDPIFYLPNYQCTMAEISSDLKNKISHRGQAMQQLQHYLH